MGGTWHYKVMHVPPCSGADRKALNADGKTALEVAQLNEQEDVIKALS